jgi:hypothetical protein
MVLVLITFYRQGKLRGTIARKINDKHNDVGLITLNTLRKSQDNLNFVTLGFDFFVRLRSKQNQSRF